MHSVRNEDYNPYDFYDLSLHLTSRTEQITFAKSNHLNGICMTDF